MVQIPWGDEFEHETARVLFGSNLLALEWAKGGSLPGDLVAGILRSLGLERESGEERRRRKNSFRASFTSPVAVQRQIPQSTSHAAAQEPPPGGVDI